MLLSSGSIATTISSVESLMAGTARLVVLIAFVPEGFVPSKSDSEQRSVNVPLVPEPASSSIAGENRPV